MEDGERAALILAEDYRKSTALADHQPANSAAVFDAEASQTLCPACGCIFVPLQRVCPDCGLNFG